MEEGCFCRISAKIHVLRLNSENFEKRLKRCLASILSRLGDQLKGKGKKSKKNLK